MNTYKCECCGGVFPLDPEQVAEGFTPDYCDECFDQDRHDREMYERVHDDEFKDEYR